MNIAKSWCPKNLLFFIAIFTLAGNLFSGNAFSRLSEVVVVSQTMLVASGVNIFVYSDSTIKIEYLDGTPDRWLHLQLEYGQFLYGTPVVHVSSDEQHMVIAWSIVQESSISDVPNDYFILPQLRSIRGDLIKDLQKCSKLNAVQWNMPQEGLFRMQVEHMSIWLPRTYPQIDFYDMSGNQVKMPQENGSGNSVVSAFALWLFGLPRSDSPTARPVVPETP